jgi:rhodanese-related sulfurtransferase
MLRGIENEGDTMSGEEMANLEITPKAVKERLDLGEKFLFIDVREAWEHEKARIEGSTLIPMREIPASRAQIEQAEDVIVFCHHGMRSMDVAVWLRGQGFDQARSMSGGIERWAAEVDPSVPRY